MEYLVAFIALMTTVIFAVVIAFNIEKGKSWALEIAQAVGSTLNLDTILDQSLTHLSTLVPYVSASIALVKNERLGASLDIQYEREFHCS